VRISARTAYGVELMTELARHYGNGRMSLRALAAGTHISEKFLSQLVLPLKACGVIHVVRAKQGGYALSRPPRQISMADIISALEGGLALADCLPMPQVCAKSKQCACRFVWQCMSEGLEKSLQKISLAEVVTKGKLGCCPPPQNGSAGASRSRVNRKGGAIRKI